MLQTYSIYVVAGLPTGERLESNANPLLSWSYGSFMFTMYFKQIPTIHNLEHTRHIIVQGMLYDNFNQMHMKVMYLAFFCLSRENVRTVVRFFSIKGALLLKSFKRLHPASA
jgi:hypothetical protein